MRPFCVSSQSQAGKHASTPHTQRLAPRTSICILPTLYKRSQSPAPSEDKAVIQPGSCDIPALRVQLGQFMNSAGSQGEVDPVL